MSDRDVRAFARAFFAAPHALDEELLVKILNTASVELRRRSALRASWTQLLAAVEFLTQGGARRLAFAYRDVHGDEGERSVPDLLATHPLRLREAGGFGTTSMLATVVALLALKVRLTPEWASSPTHDLFRGWSLAIRASWDHPDELAGLLTTRRSAPYEFRSLQGCLSMIMGETQAIAALNPPSS